TRLRTPANRTATLGLRAPVAMEVAMALPVSWNPFVKSKASAVTTSSTTMISSALMALIRALESRSDYRIGEPKSSVGQAICPDTLGVHLLFMLRVRHVGRRRRGV